MAWITAIGVRRSVRHGDVSFAGSPHGGVRLDFREPIRWTVFRVPAFYVATDDLEGFAAALAARGHPGRGRAPGLALLVHLAAAERARDPLLARALRAVAERAVGEGHVHREVAAVVVDGARPGERPCRR